MDENEIPVFPKEATMIRDTSGGSLYHITFSDAISLRDWFAGMAMQGIVTNIKLISKDPTRAHFVSESAYNMADEMIRQRLK